MSFECFIEVAQLLAGIAS